MSKKPVVLMILDGYGLNKTHEGNAVYEAKKPVMDRLMKECPFVEGQASGLAVGLPEGQMGNSEVGHLNMGAGRIVYQELTRITKSIQDGDFFSNEEFLAAVENCKKNNSALHLFGLLSDGGVHSHITHVYGLLELAKRNGLDKVFVHCFLDGRDTPPASGKDFVDLVCNEMLPAVAAEGLADFVDVFCDEGFFTVEETARILKAARKLGLRAKIHANELAVSGGVQVGVACDALSVDHLERMGREEIEALRGAATMPTLLPGAAFFLGMSYPPARAMIDAGLGVALASDYNPGSSPSGNMRMVCSLASIRMKMTPAEAINAATLNGAYAMGLSRDYGSVTLGKAANFFITKPMPSVEFFSYAYQTPLIRQVFLRGRKMCGL